MAIAPLPPSTVELEGPFAHEFVHTRGIRLHVAIAGDSADPLVVFIHGAFGGWFDFQEVIGPLAQSGYHVAAVDMRGFGMSDKPPIDPGQDIRTLVGDLDGLIQALGHDDAYIVGADTGGAVAWCLAAERPNRVRGLVSVSAAHPVDIRRAIAARPWDFGWMILRSLLCHLPKVTRANSLLLSPRAYRKELSLDTGPALADATLESILALRLRASQIGKVRRGILWNHRMRTAVVPLNWSELSVKRPVLFIHAQQRLWNPVIQRASLRARAGFSATSIPGAKNLPFLEAPEQFVDELLRWLDA